MEAMRASDSTRTPIERMSSPPGWNAFSMTMPAPTTVAPAWEISSISPFSALP